MTLEEEQKLLKYYACKIQGICQALHFPDKVRATALTFLKRAYLSFSVLDHNPKNIMLACIYLAGKVSQDLPEGTRLHDTIFDSILSAVAIECAVMLTKEGEDSLIAMESFLYAQSMHMQSLSEGNLVAKAMGAWSQNG